MRAVIQRVSRAAVRVGDRTTGEIGPGLAILLGIESADTAEDGAWLATKVASLRVFADAEGRMNLALGETGGAALVVSQFTLFGNVRKGARPSYNRAAPPSHAVPLYESFVAALSDALGRPVATGEFGADMAVELVNDGPVTLILDTKARDY